MKWFTNALLAATVLLLPFALRAEEPEGRLGIVFFMDNGACRIADLHLDAAAAKGGVRKGDVLVRVDDFSVSGATMNQVLEKLRGPVGAPVTLVVSRGDTNQLVTLKITREHISEDTALIERTRSLIYEQKYAEALPLVLRGVEKGIAEAQANLAWMYTDGHGVTRDYDKAILYGRLAANQGNMYGQNHLGYLLLQGWGAKQDFVEARQLFEKAAAAGHPIAMANLGLLYEKGWGAPVDYGESARWYRMAAERGYEEAKESLLRLPSISITGSDIQPARVNAGGKIKLKLLWEISGLPSAQSVPVTIERRLFMDAQPLFSVPLTETLSKGTGRHTTEFDFPVPKSAKPGTYIFETTIQGLGGTIKKESVFVILPE